MSTRSLTSSGFVLLALTPLLACGGAMPRADSQLEADSTTTRDDTNNAAASETSPCAIEKAHVATCGADQTAMSIREVLDPIVESGRVPSEPVTVEGHLHVVAGECLAVGCVSTEANCGACNYNIVLTATSTPGRSEPMVELFGENGSNDIYICGSADSACCAYPAAGERARITGRVTDAVASSFSLEVAELCLVTSSNDI